MRTPVVPIVLVLASGCSSYDLAFRGKEEADYDASAGPSDLNGDDVPSPEPPPEVEQDFLSLAPAQSDVHVFIANPERDTVTRVHVVSQRVDTTPVGSRPTEVRITPDYGRAVVFNQGDASVSILDALTLDQQVVPVRRNLNSLRLSPDGTWAALWHATAAQRPEDPDQGGATSFNEVSLVHLEDATHTPIVVGFNPKDIAFTPDGRTAVVVSDASLAVLRLDNEVIVPEFVEVADPLDPPLTEEVAIAPSGDWAFVRQFGVDTLTVVNLDERASYALPIGTNPTDLDLTPDGQKAVVVSRDVGQVALFDVADPFLEPTVLQIPGSTPLGSVAMAPSQTAILYTTAIRIPQYATWNLESGEITLRPLAKPVAGMTRTPTGEALLVVHTEDDASDGSTDLAYQGKAALSVIDLDDFRANTLALSAPVAGIANSNNGHYGYVIMDDQPYLEVIDYRTLIFEELELRSHPVFVGALPDLDPDDGDEPPAWVSQQHPLGRISFFDPDDDSFETITGFELNSAIED